MPFADFISLPSGKNQLRILKLCCTSLASDAISEIGPVRRFWFSQGCPPNLSILRHVAPSERRHVGIAAGGGELRSHARLEIDGVAARRLTSRQRNNHKNGKLPHHSISTGHDFVQGRRCALPGVPSIGFRQVG